MMCAVHIVRYAVLQSDCPSRTVGEQRYIGVLMEYNKTATEWALSTEP